MKKGDKGRGIIGIWSAILVPAILSGFNMGFEGEVKGGEWIS
jgi:hypothetical protein